MTAPHYEERATWRTQPSAVAVWVGLGFAAWALVFVAGRVMGWW